MITPRAARPYLRGKALKAMQAQTTAELKAWVELQRFTAEQVPAHPELISEIQKKERALRDSLITSLKAIEAKVASIRDPDPHKAVRSMFSHMPAFASGRAMAAKIIADTKAEQLDMAELERGIGEAVDADFMLEWPELDDMAFQRDLGTV